VFALVGASGGGKSTIGQMLQRFYNPLEGGIFLDGVPLSELDPVWLRQHIGVVNQEPTLFDGTVVEAAARKANAHVFIERFPDG
jgi:ABC-type multidrug transport system fused ATPase/permease subunit